MKKSLIFYLFVLAFCCNASARSFNEPVSLKQLVKESDLIVTGTLRSVSRYTSGDTDYAEGIITVEEIISGNAASTENLPLKAGDKIKLTWQNASAKIYDRIELGGSENNQTIKILKIKSDGTVTADNFFSMRAAIERQLGEIRKALRKEKTQKPFRKLRLFNEVFSNAVDYGGQTQNSFTDQNQIIESGKSSRNSLLAAFATTLFALVLYRIFYRNRFKIK